MKNEKILITGGAGYIASHTLIELSIEGFDFIVYDNLSNSSKESLKRVEKIIGKKVEFEKGDKRDTVALSKVFESFNIDAVIHFAGLKAVGESVKKPLEYYDNNIGGSIVLLECMREHQVKSFIFSSSATVYGEAKVMPITELEPLKRATNPYGQTKVDVEFICEDLFHSDNSWSLCMLRYFNPVGAHESGMIGEDPQGIPNNLMPYIAQVAIGRRKNVNIFGNDYPTKDGTGVRDYIHVVDLAKGHVAALQHCLGKAGYYTYNLGTGVGISVLDMINAFSKTIGHDLPYEFAPRRAGDIATCYSDPTKAFKELGWKSEKTVEDMTNDSWHWQSINPNGYSE